MRKTARRILNLQRRNIPITRSVLSALNFRIDLKRIEFGIDGCSPTDCLESICVEGGEAQKGYSEPEVKEYMEMGDNLIFFQSNGGHMSRCNRSMTPVNSPAQSLRSPQAVEYTRPRRVSNGGSEIGQPHTIGAEGGDISGSLGALPKVLPRRNSGKRISPTSARMDKLGNKSQQQLRLEELSNQRNRDWTRPQSGKFLQDTPMREFYQYRVKQEGKFSRPTPKIMDDPVEDKIPKCPIPTQPYGGAPVVDPYRMYDQRTPHMPTCVPRNVDPRFTQSGAGKIPNPLEFPNYGIPPYGIPPYGYLSPIAVQPGVYANPQDNLHVTRDSLYSPHGVKYAMPPSILPPMQCPQVTPSGTRG